MTPPSRLISDPALTRKAFLARAAAGMGAISGAGLLAACGGSSGGGSGASTGSKGPIKIASIFDSTGDLSIYGKQMTQMAQYATKKINADGGVLGRQLQLQTFDPKSRVDQYSRYATQVASDQDVQAVFGAITSATREAIRPVLTRRKKLLMYPVIYEGGICDTYTFWQGSDAIQQLKPLIDWGGENVGKKYYIVAADYLYGRVSTDWAKELIKQAGGQTLGNDFIPLEVSAFRPITSKIQAARPDVLVSLLVGAAHTSFFREFSSAGLKDKIQIVSPTFGLGNEEQVLSPKEGSGIVVAYAYFETLDTPQNKQFVTDFKAAYPQKNLITDLSAQTWNAMHQWAAAVNDAGSLEVEAVIKSYEKGIPFDGPGGQVKTEPKTHGNIQDMHLARVTKNRSYEVFKSTSAVPPNPTMPNNPEKCDLQAKPQQTQLKPGT
ncbi:MAG: urea transport system substrate-binding protein [Solirubrobacteraceae bacterium]|jgi:branched-chain amino acid transport system substrate-binding protein|nr:urea transport system substrate-binding protein [Solirubrobacteraceae bacterium]